MTRRQLLAATDSRELSEWQTWERIHGPLGAERSDYLAAGIRSAIFEVNRDSRKKPKPYGIGDAMVFKIPGAPAGQSTRIETPEAFLTWARAYKARQEAISARR